MRLRREDDVRGDAGVDAEVDAAHDAGDEALLIATLAAFGDRVASVRARGGEVRFAAGGSGKLARESVVRDCALITAVEVRDGRHGTLVHAASRVEPEWLLELFERRVRTRSELRFDEARERVERVESLWYEGLLLDEGRPRPEPSEAMSDALAAAAQRVGLGRLWDLDGIEALRHRVSFAREHGAPLEPVDDGAVARAVRTLAEGKQSFADLRGASLLDALREQMGPGGRAALRELAPADVPIAGRARVAVHYEAGRPPWIESRLQDFFGMADGPAVAAGRVPLVLHLLAPNRRAVQVTTDLGGFWERHYPGLRTQLMRRYPAHAWPEDGRTATPPERRAGRPRKRRR